MYTRKILLICQIPLLLYIIINPVHAKFDNKNIAQQKFFYYKVKKGDTLYSISHKYNNAISSICQLNGIKNSNAIKKGMILKLYIPKKENIKSTAQTIDIKEKLKFIWPLNPVVHYKRDGLHGVKSIGIIITGKPGSPVLSSATGEVKKIGEMRGFGKYVIIKHKNRYITVYSNLDQIHVSQGDKINSGNIIGKINNNEIHFQIDHAGKPKDPLKFLPKKS